jgi:non-ribosomal peptide synthetase component E (peptide arylation enzyme)
MLPRVPEWYVAILGLIRIGVVPYPATSLLTPKDIAYRAQTAGMKAAKDLVWIQPWENVFEGGLPDFKFFVGGLMNPCINMIDGHVEAGAGNRLALIWEGENGESKFFTYRILPDAVLRASTLLRSLELKKGDTLAMFLPNPSEVLGMRQELIPFATMGGRRVPFYIGDFREVALLAHRKQLLVDRIGCHGVFRASFPFGGIPNDE